MWSRRDFLVQTGSAAVGSLFFQGSLRSDKLIDPKDLAFLRQMARDTIKAARKDETIAKHGFAFVTPGGNYPALWIRDFSMGAGCGLLPAETIHNHLRLIARSQNGPAERRLKSGAIIPPFSIPDHIDYDGGAVFYPGTYSSGEDQGGEPWGVLPPVDDHYEFVHLAYLLWRGTSKTEFLDARIAGFSMFDRLVKALECPATDPATGLVRTDEGRRAVGFGFCDAVTLTGSILFPSLLRYRALEEIIELARASKRPVDVLWQRQRALIRTNVAKTFARDGWLCAATGIGRQPDVWGTSYAIYLDVLNGGAKRAALTALVQACRRGTITYKGGVRHVPTDHDFSPTSAWEKTAGVPRDRYQNGAYWHVPTGWLVRALLQADRAIAAQLVSDMVVHLREEDFRTGEGKGAPWECLHPAGAYRQNPVYMASITLLLETLTVL